MKGGLRTTWSGNGGTADELPCYESSAGDAQMNDFDVLLVVNVLLLLVALVRLRPATLILLGDQAIALRALATIRHYGRPSSQDYLPLSLFSDDRLDAAWWVFAIATVIVACSLAVGSSRTPENSAKLPAVPRWVLAVIAAYVLAYTFRSNTILSGSYVDVLSHPNYTFEFGGVTVLLYSVVLYELVRRVRERSLSPLRALVVLALMFLFTEFLKGHAGVAVGYLVCAPVLLFGANASTGELRRRAALWAFGAVVLAVVVAFAVRFTRPILAAEGAGAIQSTIAFVTESESAENRRRTGEGAEMVGNGAQSACHVLECTQLYDTGHSREWRSLYLTIVYTFQPTFIIEPLGIARQKEAAWELADYFTHGGGINVLGELYWNGGYLCLVLGYGLIVVLAWLCDTRAARSFPWLILATQFTPTLLEGGHYGFVMVMRGFFNGLLVLLLCALFARRPWAGRQRTVAGVVD